VSKLFQAISAIQNSDISLPRTATGQVGTREYQYLTIQKLHEAVFPLLREHKLVWITAPSCIDGVPSLEFKLAHIEDEAEVVGEFPLCLANSDPQGLGSAITYARRYALLAVLGLVGDDDDGAAGGNGSTGRPAVPMIPLDRARGILMTAQETGLAEGTTLAPALMAKLTEVGVDTGRLGHLSVDQAELVEAFLAKEAEDAR
jgi:hypothetical protein